jgi:hypothetical protein
MKKTEKDSLCLVLPLAGRASDASGKKFLFPDLPKAPQSSPAPEFDQKFLDFMISLVFCLSGRQGFLVLDFEDGMKEWGMFLHNFRSQAKRFCPHIREFLDKLIGDFQGMKADCPESLKLRSHAARLKELPYTVPDEDGYMSLASTVFPDGVRNIFAEHQMLAQIAREELRGVPRLV